MLRILLLGCMLSNLYACSTTQGARQSASVRIYGVEGFEFERYELNITATDTSNAVNLIKQGERGDQGLQLALPPATYRVDLSLYRAAELTAASSSCPEREKQNNVFAVLPGLNDLRVILCDSQATPLNTASPIIATSKGAQGATNNSTPGGTKINTISQGPSAAPSVPQPGTTRLPASLGASSSGTLKPSANPNNNMTSTAMAEMRVPKPSPMLATPPSIPEGPSAEIDITPVLRRPGADSRRGQLLYQAQCAACHGNNADGSSGGPSLTGASCKSCGMSEQFIEVTTKQMPPSTPGSCDLSCARDIAAYVLSL